MLGALLGIYLLWGTSYIAVKTAVTDIPPLLMVGLRSLFAGVLLLTLCWLTGRPMGNWREKCNAAFSGLLMIALSGSLIAIGIKTVESGIAAALFSLVPVFVCIMMMLFGQKVSRLQWLGTVIGISGLYLINIESATPGETTGLWLIMVAVVATSIAAFFSGYAKFPQDVLVSTGIQMLVGGVLTTLLAWLFDEKISMPSPAALAAFVYLIIFVSILAYLSYVYILAHAGPVLASSYAFVNPPVALLAGALLLNEPVSTQQLLSIGVVLVGAMAVLLGQPEPG